MNWSELLSQGGGWAVAVGVGYAVLVGKLRLDREIAALEAINQELREKNASLDAKIEAQNQTMKLNTDALAKNAEAQEAIVLMLQSLLPPPDNRRR